jgi:hypothetical protein
MRISEKLVASLSLMVGLATVVVPVNARGDTIGAFDEGQKLTLNGFTITNTNAFAVTLTGLATSVLKPNFDGDPGDFVTSTVFAGGTCIPLLGVAGGLAAGAACTVNLTFSSPAADVGEPVDFGVSQITLDRIFNNGPVSSLVFEIRVNDPVPEPESATLVGLGIAVLVGASCVAKKRGLIQGRLST